MPNTVRIEGGGMSRRGKTSKPSSRKKASEWTPRFVARLDPQAQAAMTGKASTGLATQPGARFTYTPPPAEVFSPEAVRAANFVPPTRATNVSIPVAPPPGGGGQPPPGGGTQRPPEIPIHVDNPGDILGGQQGGDTPPGVTTGVFDSSTLSDMLAAIEARYGLSREQLMADQSEVGRLYRFLMANLDAAQKDASRAVQEDAVSRGILRSGIFLSNQSRVENEFAQRRSQAEADKAMRLQAIQRALADLNTQLEAEKQAAAQGLGSEMLNAELQRQAASVRR